ncbi:MAG: DNA repair protein RecO [Desulfosarcina sp.]|nr:DNA repair protein RecO [Desulfobacterales bacterium]
MPILTTPAILLRRVDFGDYDLIITFFSLKKGKISLIAKSAKKSVKRFGGLLELFSLLDIVWSSGRKKGLPVLQEASLIKPFSEIRKDIKKTAYASYWAELINKWIEEGTVQKEIFFLFQYVLCELDAGIIPDAALSILFQLRFMLISGLLPNLSRCSICNTGIDQTKENEFTCDLASGGILCGRCGRTAGKNLRLARGTIKQLLWMEHKDLATAARIRIASGSMKEGLLFLESFVQYHIGKELKSLNFLKQIR